MSPPEPRTWVARMSPVVTLLAFGVIGVLAAWRLECVALGPDPDTDAYGHYIIARQLLETPSNLHIHWVWLPGYHALLALFVGAGVSLDGVRVFNALLAALPPLLLAVCLRSSDVPAHRRAIGALAAVLAAGAPIAMSMGTTGQMEVSFSALVLASAILLARERFAFAALVLSLAVLTRYEAWAAVAGVGLAMAIQAVRSRSLPRVAHLACVVCPLLAVLGWAGARWLQGEQWFGFLFDNQAFAEGALRRTDPDARWLASALARYPLTMPALSFGLPALFALAGVARTARREGIWLVVIPLAMLAFLVSGTLARSHLGLNRHFLALVPFFAIWIAHGIAHVSERAGDYYSRRLGPRLTAPSASKGSSSSAAESDSWTGRQSRRLVVQSCFALLALCAVGAQQVALSGAWRSWRENTRRALAPERAAAGFIASLPASALVACDEASLEVLSGVESERFMRARVRRESVPELRRRSEADDVFVVSKSERIAAVGELGPIVYRGPRGAPYAALHVEQREPAATLDTSSPPIRRAGFSSTR